MTSSRCSACGESAAATAKFCSECGASLSSSERPPKIEYREVHLDWRASPIILKSDHGTYSSEPITRRIIDESRDLLGEGWDFHPPIGMAYSGNPTWESTDKNNFLGEWKQTTVHGVRVKMRRINPG